MANKFIDTLSDKYIEIVKLLVIFDEWVYLLSNKHVFESIGELNMIKRLIVIVQRCRDNLNSKGCADLCSEFNINKYSYIFDGEPETWNDF